jgi:hypothetical protein
VIDIKVLNKQLKDVEIKQNELRKAKWSLIESLKGSDNE